MASEKRAPVQGFSAGIPWSMHLRAYDAYCKKYGKQEALIDLEGKNCRGGFGTRELDELIPGWRDELSEIGKLRAQVDTLRKALKAADNFRAQFIGDGALVTEIEDWNEFAVLFDAASKASLEVRKIVGSDG
ncbi:hypothetical protein [Hyphomicrobium sp.]|uniref:hypothetical protein n=1 Tax=Hyphomicrobium sp. TaxID=82 RepID=UPI001D731009|nr:hypothetical protein [Hyphomicrobium sp.]MBY0561445.1 hypothetical protein [Hyphomicrobium sp.]